MFDRFRGWFRYEFEQGIGKLKDQINHFKIDIIFAEFDGSQELRMVDKSFVTLIRVFNHRAIKFAHQFDNFLKEAFFRFGLISTSRTVQV